LLAAGLWPLVTGRWPLAFKNSEIGRRKAENKKPNIFPFSIPHSAFPIPILLFSVICEQAIESLNLVITLRISIWIAD
jgi:hypothetical protein